MTWTPQELLNHHRRLIRDQETLRDRIKVGFGPDAEELKMQLPTIEAELEEMRKALARTKAWIARLAELN